MMLALVILAVFTACAALVLAMWHEDERLFTEKTFNQVFPRRTK